MIERTIICGVCGASEKEPQENSGWPGWGRIEGVEFNGVPNPHLCPEHLKKAVDALDKGD